MKIVGGSIKKKKTDKKPRISLKSITKIHKLRRAVKISQIKSRRVKAKKLKQRKPHHKSKSQ
jgi:hypothetical protein